MNLRYRLFFAFFVVILLTAGAGIISLFETKNSLERSIGGDAVVLALETIETIDRIIAFRIEEFQSTSKSPSLIEAVKRSNEEFDLMSNETREQYILEKDMEWTSAPKDEITPFMEEIINREASIESKSRLDYYSQKYGYPVYAEMFVTNKYGVNVIQSHKTSDFYQADEFWWQEAMETGLHVSDVEYDESAEVYSLDISMRIEDEEGNFLGVLKAVYNIEEVNEVINYLAQRIEEEVFLYGLVDPTELEVPTDIEINLITKDGSIIHKSSGGSVSYMTGLDEKIDQDLLGLIHSQDKIQGTSASGGYIVREDNLFAYSNSRGYRDFEGLGWMVIFEYDTPSIFYPVQRMINFIFLVSFALFFLSVIISIFISKRISDPIVDLKKTSEEFSKGNLDARVKVRSNDELGNLSRTFNDMANNLKKLQSKLLESEKVRSKGLEVEVGKTTKDLEAKVEELKKAKTAILNMLEDLTESNRHLKDLDKAKSDFLNIVSHELKTPLTAIFAYSDILDDLKGNFTEDEKKSFEAIKRNSHQLKSLIDNILEISRIAAGKFELINSKVDVNQKIRESVDNLAPLAENKGIKLLSKVGKESLNAYTDEQRLTEILNNLISNAIKFTEKGNVSISSAVEGKFFRIDVKDTGVGIPKTKLKHLGERFYQVDAGVSRKFGGTGLGISITKQLAELQGGQIEIRSTLGKGSTFSAILPIKSNGGKSDGKDTLRRG